MRIVALPFCNNQLLIVCHKTLAMNTLKHGQWREVINQAAYSLFARK
jgi:hypothetical protein